MNSGPILIECQIEAGNWPAGETLERLSAKAVGAAVAEMQLSGQNPSELSLLFTDDSQIEQLNKNWRGQEKPTNVLSFPVVAATPGTALEPMLGDIILSFETVGREAALENKPFDHHLTHLIVHGFLHLLGYDHQTEIEAGQMEALEQRILRRLAIPDPYGERQGCD